MYQRASTHYKLPVPVMGDVIEPDEERRFAEIIDTQLHGAILSHCGGHGSAYEGTWTTTFYTGDSVVDLAGFQGFINQIYVFDNSTLEWSGLTDNAVHYLWVRLIEDEANSKSSRQYGHIITDRNTTGATFTDGVLLAVVVTSDTGMTLNLYPSGKATCARRTRSTSSIS